MKNMGIDKAYIPLALLTLTGCAEPGSDADTAMALSAIPTAAQIEQAEAGSRLSAAELDLALREIAALPTPEDIDAAVFAELKAELARLLAEPEHAARQAERSVSQGSKRREIPEPFQLRVDHSARSMRWWYLFSGDYDQNGEVNAADIVPLALHLGEFAGSGSSSDYYAIGSTEYLIDRNGDGFITMADLVAIAANYGNRLQAYDLYATEDLQDFPFPEDSNGTNHVLGAEPFGQLAIADADIDPLGQKYFMATLSGELLSYCWTAQRSTQKAAVHSYPGRNGSPYESSTGRLLPYREPATRLSYDPALNQVSWLDIFAGDGDGNREVNVADVTPIGTNFGSEFDAENPDYAIYNLDFNRDGVVNLFDIDVILLHMGGYVEGYRLYHAAGAEALPDGYWGSESNLPVEYTALPDGEAFLIEASLPFTPASGSYLYLRPYFGDELGPVCEFVQVP